MPPLQGLIAAPFTPLKIDGSLNLDQVGRYAEHLSRHKVSGAFVGGTTGEGASLTTEERQRLALQWHKTRPKDLKLIVHVGHQSISESRILAAHAQQIGADAIGALAPSFFRPGSLAELVTCCAQIASAAPDLPFYYYHMPAMTGVNFAMAEFFPRAVDAIPTFAGIKFTHENLMDYGVTLGATDAHRSILFGRDEILLCALSLGATGAVGSTYNYIAPLFHRIIAAYKAGNNAQASELQHQAMRIIAIMSRHGGLSAGKVMMNLVGVDCGPMRLPLPTLTRGQTEALRTELESAAFLENSRAAGSS